MDPVMLVQRLAGAVAARDEASARGLCAPGAWDAPRGGLLVLYRQLTGGGRSFRLDIAGPPIVSEWSRAAVRCQVIRDGDVVSMVSLLCDGIPGRMTGWSRSAIVGERYVAGMIPPRFGIDDLDGDPRAYRFVERLAERLEAAAAGDPKERAHLHDMMRGRAETREDGGMQAPAGVEAAVLQHLQMRVRSGQRLTVVRALRLGALGRVAVEACLGRPVRAVELTGRALAPALGQSGPGETVWLYADEAEDGRLQWYAITALFHADTLLA